MQEIGENVQVLKLLFIKTRVSTEIVRYYSIECMIINVFDDLSLFLFFLVSIIATANIFCLRMAASNKRMALERRFIASNCMKFQLFENKNCWGVKLLVDAKMCGFEGGELFF